MKDFTTGSIPKQLAFFAAPIVLGDMLQSVYSIIDAIWVGRLIGPNALAAVSASMPLVFFLVSFVIGLAAATVILVGQAYGAKKMDFLAKVLSNSLITTTILCVVITALSITFANPLLHLLNTPPEIQKDAHTFFIIIIGGICLTFFFNWFSGVLRGMGDSKTPLMLLSISVGLNIILVPFLIKGIGPIPPLGIAGSALATVISNFVAVLIAVFYVLKTNTFFKTFKWNFTADWQIIKKMFGLGIPISLSMIVVSLSAVLIVSLVNKFGVSVTAAYGIGLRIDQFSFLPAMSTGLAVSSMVAQNLGAGKKERVPEILKWALIISLSFGTFFFILVNIFPTFIAQAFTKDAIVAAEAVKYFKIVSFTYFTFAIMFAFQGVVRGAGDTVTMFLITAFSILIFRVPLAYGLAEHTGLKERGIWFGMLFSAGLAVILNIIYYFTGRWKNKVVITRQGPPSKLEECTPEDNQKTCEQTETQLPGSTQ